MYWQGAIVKHTYMPTWWSCLQIPLKTGIFICIDLSCKDSSTQSGYQVMLWRVMAAGVIFTTSPSKCTFTYTVMGLAPYTCFWYSWQMVCSVSCFVLWTSWWWSCCCKDAPKAIVLQTSLPTNCTCYTWHVRFMKPRWLIVLATLKSCAILVLLIFLKCWR